MSHVSRSKHFMCQHVYVYLQYCFYWQCGQHARKIDSLHHACRTSQCKKLHMWRRGKNNYAKCCLWHFLFSTVVNISKLEGSLFTFQTWGRQLFLYFLWICCVFGACCIGQCFFLCTTVMRDCLTFLFSLQFSNFLSTAGLFHLMP